MGLIESGRPLPMFKPTMTTIIHCICFIAISLVTVYSQEQPPSVAEVSRTADSPSALPISIKKGPTADPAPAIEKISPGIFRIGQLTINKNERSITLPAQINMDKGLLEYLLVKHSGKTHESLLRTAVEPYHLQLACLLLGMEGTERPLAFQGAPETPSGEPVEITITYMSIKGKPITIPPQEWLATIQEMKQVPVRNLSLVYTGSIINQGRFIAQTEGSMIALYHDPAAIIDNSSPGGEINNYWAVREGSVPPVGTSVTISIKTTKR
jgi:hypothetical protein